jgi:ribosomal protein S18 acetylase RimI-like enzyme
MHVEPYAPSQADAVAKLSLRAWSSVFDSLKEALAPAVWEQFYPDGWRVSQEKSVRDACASADFKTWVAIEGGAVAGFVAIRFHEGKLGEIYMIAVDPDYQRRGIAMTLTDFAVARMKEAGMEIAMVETGGDWGHAPARAAYEKAGFRVLPLARYFKKI